MTIDEARKILKKYYSYDDFRENQIPAIKNILNKKNCFIIMPTGGGKSILYTIPALLYKNLTIVISPLIALMQDQVLQLKAHNIDAEYISYEKNNFEEIKKSINNIKILFVSPERFVSKKFIDWIKNIKLSLIALDEAHTFTEFGLKFRSDYRKLFETLKNFNYTQFIALTATASKNIYDDISKNYNFDEIISFPMFRKNLHIKINYFKTDQERDEAIFNSLDNNKINLIYAYSRKRTEKVYNINHSKINNMFYYHAKIPASVKKEVLAGFIKEKYKIISATTAFGMGIDKANVRVVNHINLPLSIEDYTQQIGRAGRDGKISNVILWISYNEIVEKLKYLINEHYFEKLNIILNSIRKNKKIKLSNKYTDILKVNKIIEVINPKIKVKILKNSHKFKKLNQFLKIIKNYQNNYVDLNIISKIFKEKNWIIEDILVYLKNEQAITYEIKEYNIIKEISNIELKTLAQNTKIEEINNIINILQYIFSYECRHKYLSNFFRFDIENCNTSCDNCKNKHLKELNIKKIDLIKLLSSKEEKEIIREKIGFLLKNSYKIVFKKNNFIITK